MQWRRRNRAGPSPQPVVDPTQEAGHLRHHPRDLVLPALHLPRAVKTVPNIDRVVGSPLQLIQIIAKIDLRSAGEGSLCGRSPNANGFRDQVESLAFRRLAQYFQRRAQESLQAASCVGPFPEHRRGFSTCRKPFTLSATTEIEALVMLQPPFAVRHDENPKDIQEPHPPDGTKARKRRRRTIHAQKSTRQHAPYQRLSALRRRCRRPRLARQSLRLSRAHAHARTRRQDPACGDGTGRRRHHDGQSRRGLPQPQAHGPRDPASVRVC